ncbi:hypothetical protein Y032_0046g1330 [Ancylostoma ceylanicum]|uniref:Uncharacterized protein n=1 Tax=Ancylostoma ceylanicum TaxID=53326 RepID=A0A016UCG4_9BILA|nr:hypothetical protein Y032_0046g1330 [Ancylostoma ceylanicum]
MEFKIILNQGHCCGQRTTVSVLHLLYGPYRLSSSFRASSTFPWRLNLGLRSKILVQKGNTRHFPSIRTAMSHGTSAGCDANLNAAPTEIFDFEISAYFGEHHILFGFASCGRVVRAMR